MGEEEISGRSFTIDDLVERYELNYKCLDGGPCEYILGKGKTLTRIKCEACIILSRIVDLDNGRTQRITSGSLTGREIEIIPLLLEDIHLGKKEAEFNRKIYVDCDEFQRKKKQCLLQRNYLTFFCNNKPYILRERIPSSSPPIPIHVAVAQMVELFSEGLPQGFIHVNPTSYSIRFRELLFPIIHRINREDGTIFNYSSRYLIQIDLGIGSFINKHPLSSQYGSIILTDKGDMKIRDDTDFTTFQKDYCKFSQVLGLYCFLCSLFSYYDDSDTIEYVQECGIIKTDASTFRELYEESVVGQIIKSDITSKCLSIFKKFL